MKKLKILSGPDRLAFMNSLFSNLEAIPFPGLLSRPPDRGGNIPPDYKGEIFTAEDEEGRVRAYPLIISTTGRTSRYGFKQTFTAFLWAQCEDFRDIWHGSEDPWVKFKGFFDFETATGELEIVPD